MASTTPIYEIVLKPSDVPGAIFEHSDVQQHSVIQLKRWLECRGLPVSGSKSELVDRCNQCISNGSDGSITISVDKGKWYEKKVQGVLASLQSSTVNTPAPPPITGWKQFPSGSIPAGFTYGDIYDYIIASARMTSVPGSRDDGDDHVDDESFCTSKPMKKGRDFFKSGHIQNIETVTKHNLYYLKSNCLPSYQQHIVYHVHATLDNFGSVQDASCDCVGSATGRCSHIAALLFALEDYVITFGCQPPSCTSRLCAWNKPRNKKRNPQPAHELQYSKKRAPNRVIVHDPCPVLDHSTGTKDSFASSFISSALNLQDNTCWHSILEVPYQDYNLTNELKLYLLSKYDMFMSSTLENISEHGSGPYQCPGTLDQASSDEWHSYRWSRITASIFKKASIVQTSRGKYNLLANHFWGLNKVNTCDMQYGCRNENNAFEEYQLMFADKCTCVKSGFWVNSRYPELGCSPDGLISSSSLNNEGDGVLEIKCPALLEGFHPLEVKKNLTKRQYQSFCSIEENGKLKLKQNHEYYFQCQMQMAVCERKYCDFVIWSPKGMCIERLHYNKLFFEKNYAVLQKLYKFVIVPELFEMRVPRKLLPFDLSD